MNELFLKILDMSLTASLVIAVVLPVRWLLRKSPKWLSYALWSVVLFRLICPVSFSAPVSVVQISQPQVVRNTEATSTITYLPPEISQPTAPAEPAVQPGPQSAPEQTGHQMSAGEICTYIWLAGLSVMTLHSLVTYAQLYRRLVGAMPFRGRVYLADHIPTPFVLGVLRPKIYLPSGTPARERQYILAHEEHHIRRGDHVIKVLAYAALCLHWFNPLVWLAFFLAGKDMEMSCDEAVIRRLGVETRADYAQTLLRLATHRPIIAGTPLAFGEGDTKGRVKNLAKWRRPKTWVVVISIVLCAVVLFLCAGNPKEEEFEYHVAAFTLKIPEGYRLELEDDKNIHCFMKGDQVAGGLRFHHVPEKYVGNAFVDLDWIFALDSVNGESRSGDIYQEPVDGYFHVLVKYKNTSRTTNHHFYEYGDRIYEIWFDNAVIPEDDQNKFLENLQRSDRVNIDKDIEEMIPTVNIGLSLPADVVDVDYVTGEIRFFLTEPIPGQISSQVMPEELLGGIRTYDAPEHPLGSVIMETWLRELGVPQIVEGGYDWMTGHSSYGDVEVSFADAAGRETIHQYYVQEDTVYELWLDTQKLDAMTRAAIFQSVYFDPEAKIDRSLPVLYPDAVIGDMVEQAELDEEAYYLELCRDFLEELQACQNYVVQEAQSNYGGRALNDTSTELHAVHGENWLRMVSIPQDGILDGVPVWESKFAEMYLNGQYYDNMADSTLTENREVHWGKTDTVYEKSLWFHRFDWDAQDVVYVSKTPAGNGMCITLQVMAPYYESYGKSYGHYFVNFIFDGNIQFQRAEITAYFHDEETGDYSIQETLRITSREDGMAEEILNYEYQRFLKGE